MKTLETNFTANADKSGNNRFIQLRKDKNAAMYRRETLTGNVIGFEVFLFRTVLQGSPLPGGGTVSETYESYPGGKAFGRSAWFIGGHQAEQRANERFNELVNGSLKTENAAETDETATVSVVKVSKVRTERPKLKWPEGPFSQRELADMNGFFGENYKKVYTDLQNALHSSFIVKDSQRDSSRGKKTQLFRVVVLKPVMA